MAGAHQAAAAAGEPQAAEVGKKRCAESLPEKRRRRVPRVAFSHVSIRSHELELWGGGGVPGDGGAPLGIGWAVMGERQMPIDEFEESRREVRRPKELYGMQGSVAASRRCELLIRAGASLKQIRSVKQAVARLNRQRWQASSYLFGNAWLFAAPAETDVADVLSMVGTPDATPVLLDAHRWRSAAAFAQGLSGLLPPERLLAPRAADDYLSLDWGALSLALVEGLASRQRVIVVSCAGLPYHGSSPPSPGGCSPLKPRKPADCASPPEARHQLVGNGA